MLKSLLITLFIGSTAHAITTIPDGSYEGSANWKDSNGANGQYKVTTLVQGGVLMSSYFYKTGNAIYAFRMDETTNGFFDVMYNGKKVGTGYCLTVQCHYTANFDGTELEESLTFWQGYLYRTGSKKVKGVTIGWEEALKKVK